MNSSVPRRDRLKGSSLLAVFAHPDDESLACGGLLALCADRGVRVSLLCATPGNARGTSGGRIDELKAAAGVLGIADVDVLAYEDGMLPWADAEALERDIRGAIERTRAEVVITFGEDGLYWHPDHIAVHERTAAVISALGTAAPALYYVIMPTGQMRRVMETAAANAARSNPGAPGPRLILGIDDPDAFGAEAQAPTVIIDIAGVATRKLAAIRCHVSQLRNDAFDALSDGDALRLLTLEHLRRADIGARGDTFIERLTE